MKDAYLKILDVNFDRAKEGMRVAEEILRFIICDKPLTLTAKNIRHKLTAVFKQFKITEFSLSYARNVNKDFGQRAIFLEKKNDLTDVFLSNIHRAEEALRVLEEISLLFDFELFKQFKALRFKVYRLEKESITKLKVLSNR